jgi:hypothetical protein
MTKINDPTYDFVRSIYMKNVPLQSELSNPFAANKRQKKNPLAIKESKERPLDISDWSAKHFVDYFSENYKAVYKGIYKTTYTSDNKIINIICEFMEDNLLVKNEGTKKFIDWCFLNKEIIQKKSGHFLLMELPHFLNRYYQDVILTNSTTSQIEIFSEIEALAANGRSKEIYGKYGIPVACTYYKNYRDVTHNDLVEGTKLFLSNLSNGNSDEKKLLNDIVQKSISRSPYIDGFELTDWRALFSEIVERFKEETWWRDQDYPGNPRFKYDKFIK